MCRCYWKMRRERRTATTGLEFHACHGMRHGQRRKARFLIPMMMLCHEHDKDPEMRPAISREPKGGVKGEKPTDFGTDF
jgi:hypothetical protein